MKHSFKQITLILSVFLIGIFTSELISHEPLIYKAIQEAIALNGSWSTIWTAFASLATLAAAVIALYVARFGAKQSQNQHQEMINEARSAVWFNAGDNAKMASYYFLHLSRSSLMQAKNKHLGKTDEQDKKAYDEIYNKWSQALSNKDFTDTITTASSLLENGSLVDELTQALFTLSTTPVFTNKPHEEQAKERRKEIWQHLSKILCIFHDQALLECHRSYLKLSSKEYKIRLNNKESLSQKEKDSLVAIQKSLVEINTFRNWMKSQNPTG